MDHSRVSVMHCCAKINNPNCSRKKLRSITPVIIANIHSRGFDHQLDETMYICESCRGLLVHNRAPPIKKRRSDGNKLAQGHHLEDSQPSTSYQESRNRGSEIHDSQPSTSHHADDILGKLSLLAHLNIYLQY